MFISFSENAFFNEDKKAYEITTINKSISIWKKNKKEILDNEKPEVVAQAQELATEMLLNIHLAELRERAALTQNELALAMGVKQPTISGMEKIGQDIKLSSLRGKL